MLGPERNVANRNRKKQTGGRGDRVQYDVEIHGGGGGESATRRRMCTILDIILHAWP